MIFSERQFALIDQGATLARVNFHVFQEKVLDILCAWDALPPDCTDQVLQDAIIRVREHCSTARCCEGE
jgi:hypothetical protein